MSYQSELITNDLLRNHRGSKIELEITSSAGAE